MSFSKYGVDQGPEQHIHNEDKGFAQKANAAKLKGTRGSIPTVNTARNKELNFSETTPANETAHDKSQMHGARFNFLAGKMGVKHSSHYQVGFSDRSDRSE